MVVSNTKGRVTSDAATLTVKRSPSRAIDHHRNHESDGNGGADSDLHGGCGRDSTTQLPVAEERREHRRSYGSELHHAGDNHVGQWIDICCCSEQHDGNGDQRGCDADGESCPGRTLDHNLTHESDGNGGTDSDLHGGCGRNSTAQLPVAEERREYRRSYGSELHHAGDNHVEQWIDIRCGSEQHDGNGDQCGCDADGESCPGRTLDHNLTHESDGDGGTDSDLHGGCGRNSTTQLPVAEERREYRRSYGSELHHAGDNHVGQWIDIAVVVSNTVGTVTSAAATLTVNPAPVGPSITTSPTNQTVTAGQAATFTVVAAGTAPLSYQWQKNGVNIAGATATSYTTPVTTTSNSGSTFAVVVSNTVGTVTSAAATLTVNPAPVGPSITTSPTNQTVTAGQTATFTVVAAGTAPLSYQWQKNGVNIAGATATSYATPVTTTSDNGSTFAVVVSNTVGTVTSAAATLTVNAAPVAGIQVSSSSINFVSEVVGNNSSQALIITNTGTATLTITQVTEIGSAFSVSGFSVPLNVSVGQKTTITVAFQPTTVGAASGNISIVSNAPGSPTSVGLSGTGIAATLTLGISPTSLSFGNVTTGASSASQTVTITNTGNANVTISQITLSGSGYAMTGGSAPVTLSPSQNLTLSVQFSPTAAGSVTGTISIVSNASGSPATIALSGTGVASIQHSVDLTWTASTSTVSGYNVYRSTVSGSSYTKINSSLVTALNYTDSTVQNGVTYYYVTTAVDSSGNESAYSTVASAIIP